MVDTSPEAAQRELSRGTLELAVLALIDEKPRYGYDLLTSLMEATEGAFGIKEGTLYPVLHRLDDAGFIAATWQAEGRAAPRKYYSLTTTGKERLSLLSSEWERLATGMSRVLDGGGRK